jgi:YD repeat-containing protein
MRRVRVSLRHAHTRLSMPDTRTPDAPRRSHARVRTAALAASVGALAVFGALGGVALSASQTRLTLLAPGPHRLIPPPADIFKRHRLAPLTAAQRQRAVASRSEFRGLTARQAVKLAETPAGALGLAARSFYQPLMLRKGERVLGYVNNREALVQEPAARRGTRINRNARPARPRVAIAQSVLPMLVGAGKHRRPVDLSLERHAGALTPAASVVPVALTPDVVSFLEQRIVIRLEDARPGRLINLGHQAFQHAVLPDTDMISAPLASGAEQWLQVRSPAAPEVFRFQLTLPAGAKLTAQSDGSAVVTRQKHVLLFIPGATATDANGRPVSVSSRVDGSALVLGVRHREDAQVAYPIALDPIEIGTPCGIRHVQDQYDYAASECGQGTTGSFSTNPPEPFKEWQFQQSGPAFAQLKSGYLGYGLYVYANPGVNYSYLNYGEYVYYAPPGAFIQRVDYAGIEHTASGTNNSAEWQGIYNTNAGQWEPESVYNAGTTAYLGQAPLELTGNVTSGAEWEMYVGNSTIPPNPDGAVPVSNVTGANGNAAVFGLVIGNGGVRPSSPLDLAFMQGATVWLYDFTPPTITSAAPAAPNGGAWTDDGDQTYPLTVAASDNSTSQRGIGMKYLNLGVLNNNQLASLQTQTNTCTGDHTGTGYCPQSWSYPFSYQLPEGVDTIVVGAYDALKNVTNQSVTARIDRSPPSETLSGPLWQANANNSNGSSSAHPLTGAAYQLNVSAQDNYSGVAEIDVQVDGGTPQVFEGNCRTTPTQTAVAGCDNNQQATYLFSNESYPAGQHTITVTTKDWLGTSQYGQPGLASHITTQTFTIYTQPAVSLGGTQSQLQSDTLGLENFYDYRSTPTGAGSSLSVNLGTGNAVWSWTPVVDPGQGLASFIELTYNAQQRLSDLQLVNNATGQQLANGEYDQAGNGFSLGIDGLTRLNEPLDISQASGDPALNIPGRISFTDIDGTRHTFIQQPNGSWQAPPGVFLHLRHWATYNPASPSQDAFNKGWVITRPNGVTFFFDQLGYESSIVDRTGSTITFNRQFVLPLSLQQQLGTSTSPLCEGIASVGVLQALSGILGSGCAEQVTTVQDQGGRMMSICYYATSTLPGCPTSDAVGLLDDRNGKVASITDHAGHILQLGYDSSGNYLQQIVQAAGESASRTFTLGYGAPGQDVQSGLGELVPSLLGTLGTLGDDVSAALFPQHLTSITDPRQHTTSISYTADPFTGTDPCPVGETSSTVGQAVAALLNLEPVCVTSVTARDGGTTNFAYQTGLDQHGNVDHTAIVTGPQTDASSSTDAHCDGSTASAAEVWCDTTDQFFRPVKQVDPLGRETDTVWNDIGAAVPAACSNAPNQPATEPGNTIASQTTGNIASGFTGSPAPATTNYCYEQNGETTEQQGPFSPGQSPTFRDTKTSYQESAGPTALQAPGGGDTAHCTSGDSSQCYVADQTEQDVSSASGTEKTLYAYDSTDPYDGLITQVTDPDGQTWKISYYPGSGGNPSGNGSGTTDAGGGLIEDKTDPVGNDTHYASYDPNGLATKITAPGQSTETTYQYDIDGNLLAVTDPRNASPTSLNGQDPTAVTATAPYTTYHAYNTLNEQTDTWTPKDMSASPPVWIHDTTTLDPNGNVQSTTVGDDGSTTPTTTAYTYTYMDQQQTKTVQGVPTSEQSAGQSGQATSFCYDLNGDLVNELLPAGQPSGSTYTCASGQTDPGTHEVHYVRDADGEVLVQEQLTTTDTLQAGRDQLTSYAYDARGNQIASADPVDNAAGTPAGGAPGVTTAIQNAASAFASGSLKLGPWRTATVFDAANEPIDQVQNPDASDGRTYDTRSQYDGAGNLLATESAKESQTYTPSIDGNGQYELQTSGKPVTSYTYNARDLLQSATNPDGDETLYGRRSDGKICWILSPDGVAYQQSQSNGLPSSTDCSQGTKLPYMTAYTYTAQDWLAQITLPTAPGEYSYGTEPMTVTYARNLVGDPTTITDPRGTTINNTFYATGDLETTSAPWWWTYDPTGSGAGGPDPNTGGQGQLQSDTPDQGLQIREKSLQEIYAQNQQTAKGQQLPSDGISGNLGDVPPQKLPGILPNAGQTDFNYDGHMWLTSVLDAQALSGHAGALYTTSLAYDPGGRLTTLNQPFDGITGVSTTSYTYDADGNKLTATTPSVSTLPPGEMLDNETDGGGVLASKAVPTTGAQTTTTYTYDGLDRLQQVNAPGASDTINGPLEQQKTSYCYYLAPSTSAPAASANVSPCPVDGGTNRASVAEPDNISFEIAQRVLEIDPLNDARTVDYDAQGNELASTDPLGNQTSYEYDPLADQTAIVRPLGNVQGGAQSNEATTQTFDQAGRLTVSTDASGKPTSYTYDADGNMTQRDAPGAGVSQSNPSPVDQITDYAYNGRGLLWKTTTGVAAGNNWGPDTRTTVTETDGDGNVIRTVSPAGTPASVLASPFNSYDGSYTTTGQGTDTAGQANIDATIDVYDQDNQLTASWLPWGCNLTANSQTSKQNPCEPASIATGSDPTPTDTRRWRIDYTRTAPTAAGGDWLQSVTQPYQFASETPTQAQSSATVFHYQPNGWISQQVSPQFADGSQQTTSYTYDPAGDQIVSQLLDTGFSGSPARTFDRSYWPDQQPQELDTSSSANPTTADHVFDYTWLQTGQLSKLNEGSLTGTQLNLGEHDTACYDSAGRPVAVDQYITDRTQGNASPQFDTLFSYDADGNVLFRSDNGTLGTSNSFSCQLASISQGQQLPLSGYSRGQTSTFAYDNLDRETSMSVDSNINDTPQQPNRLYTAGYWPSGQIKFQARQQTPAANPAPTAPSSLACPYTAPSGGLIEECHYYNTAGQASQDVRSSDSENQAFSYDTDGNRSTDERGSHAYNALDQEVLWTRGGQNTQDPGGTAAYTLDGAGALLQEVDNLSFNNVSVNVPGGLASVNEQEQITTRHCSTATAATTDPPSAAAAANAPMCQTDNGRTENLKTTATVTGNITLLGIQTPINAPSQTTTQLDCYNGLGQLQQVVQTPDACGATSPNPARTSQYSYNDFGAEATQTVPDPTLLNAAQTVTDSYKYDALGRRYQKTQSLSTQTGSNTSNYAYLGLSTTAVTWDQTTTAQNTNSTNSYDYSSRETPVGVNIDSTNDNYYSYALDPSGSVQGIESADGQVDDGTINGQTIHNAYHYTPYGEPELGSNQTTNPLGTDTVQSQLSQDAQANEVQYQGFVYNQAGSPDPASVTSGILTGPALPQADSYTMPARDYLPGQAIYQTPDTFEQSTAGQTQAASPLTQEPYTFAAGNPTTNIEIDGHGFLSGGNGQVGVPQPNGGRSVCTAGCNQPSPASTTPTAAPASPISGIGSIESRLSTIILHLPGVDAAVVKENLQDLAEQGPAAFARGANAYLAYEEPYCVGNSAPGCHSAVLRLIDQLYTPRGSLLGHIFWDFADSAFAPLTGVVKTVLAVANGKPGSAAELAAGLVCALVARIQCVPTLGVAGGVDTVANAFSASSLSNFVSKELGSVGPLAAFAIPSIALESQVNKTTLDELLSGAGGLLARTALAVPGIVMTELQAFAQPGAHRLSPNPPTPLP